MPKTIYSRQYAELCLLLAECRRENGLSQSALAARLGLTQSRVSKIERGERRLDVVELRDWCLALGTSLASFVARLESRISRRR